MPLLKLAPLSFPFVEMIPLTAKNMTSTIKLRSIALLSGFITLFVTQDGSAQGASAVGRITGRVIDAQTGAGLSAVTVQIVGSGLGAISGIDGRYVIPNVPVGTVALRASSIGYATKTVTSVSVSAGANEMNVALETEAVSLGAIEVTAAAERGSVNRALDQQRTATGIVNAVTAEQISKSPDGDAAQAVQRVSGVTVQDGKFVVVRGLGERYTTTSLNGSRIPSPEPEKKLVPLDIFPSALLESITTSKTFTPDQSGDFSGAQVDIKMREFPAEQTRTLTTSVGWNAGATGRSVFAAPAAGGEAFGFAGGSRAVPAGVRAAGNFLNGVTIPQMNDFVNSFRNTWSAKLGTGAPIGSIGASIGGNDLFFGQRVGYVLSGTYSYTQEVRDNEMRALAQPSVTGGTEEIDRFQGQTGRSSVLWGGVLNATTLLGSTSRLSLNTTYNRSADNEARREFGVSENYTLPLDITRLRYVERGVGSVQVAGEHELSAHQRLSWATTASRVARNEPDRSEVVYARETDPQTGVALKPAWFATAGQGAVRTFGALTERALDAKVDYKLEVGNSHQSFVKAGALYRVTNRNTDNFVYSITAPLLDRASRELAPEEIFDGRFSQPGMSYFQVAPLAQGGSYVADDHLAAGYAMIDAALTSRIRVITGARIEHSSTSVTSEPTFGSQIKTTPRFTDVLPSLAINIALSEKQNLRFSASQTLSRPEYREMARVQYRDVIGAENVVGNPDLVRALIKNVDARWELYPNAGEILSVALFAKQFDNPIERVYLGTSGTRIVTFLNADGATNYGVELEARKRVFDNLVAFSNATLMKSEIEIGSSDIGASKINDKRPMVGQSPYVINAGATYSVGGASATLLYNVYGKRIVSAAERPLPDVYEQARNSVDVSLRLPLLNGVSARFDARNLLDAPYKVVQGTVVRESYTTGRVISAGINWRP